MGRRRGFTLVELIIVIAVIGILATITLIGFSRFQADGRDARRESSVAAIVEALEKYYDAHGEYPSCEDVMAASSTLTTETLVGLQKSTVVAPQAPSGQSNSIECGVELTMDGEDFFLYTGDGSASCNGNESCLNYTISYKSESDGTIKTTTSRRNTAIATSGAAQLSASNTRFTTVGLSWTAVPNAANYTVQSATNAAFTTGLTEYNANAAVSTTVTGLSAGSNYWFRVKPSNVTGEGLWSNTLPVSTLTLSSPSVSTDPVSNTQINVSWNTVPNATSYTLQYSTSAGMTSPTTIANISTTSRSITGLATGTTYYFQVRADAPSDNYSGPYSAVVAETTVVPAPTCASATTASATQINVTWCSVAVADSYTLEHSTSSTFASGVTSITGLTGTSRSVTGLTQGTTRYFRVKAVVDTSSSAASPTASATTTVNAPGAPGVAASQPGAVRSCASGYWVQYPAQCPNNYYASGWVTSASCPAGTYAVYQLMGRYNSPSTAYYSGATTQSQWFLVSARSGYYTLWAAQYYCQGPNANSGWGPWSGEVRT